jgi:polar amino acid transport system substrate-binding protein
LTRSPLRFCIHALFASLLLAAVPARATAPAALGEAVIQICDDINEWPPYLYYERAGGVRTNKLVGYSMDVVDAILTGHHLRYEVTLLPWARCLADVKAGKFSMALNLVHTEQRANDYFLTETYYSVRNFYFYSRKHYPNGLPIQGVADVHKYKVCGILNYDHSNMGFKPGEIDQGAKTYDALIAKLHLGRCTLFVSQFEAMLGYALIGQSYFNDPDLGYAQIPSFKLASFAMAVTRHAPYGAQLRDLLNHDIAAMQASGQLDAIWKRHIPPNVPQSK